MAPPEVDMLTQAPFMAVIYAPDPSAVQAFYQDVLGLEVTSVDPMGVEFNAGGTVIRLAHNPQHTPAHGTVAGWFVDDLDATIAALAERGVAMEHYDQLEQDAQGVWTVPGGGPRISWFKDPVGNTLSLRQDP